MLALRWSYAQDLFLVAVLGATTLVAVPHHRHRCHRQQIITPTTPTITTDVPPPITLGLEHAQADADAHYLRQEFALAAESLRAAHDPSLEANAQLYEQLARAWDRAFARDASAVVRFEALRYARRLDLAFGGYYANELDDHLRETAPLAATMYAHDHDREGLELALTTCDALGVPTHRLVAARR
ncbi:MAG: hypothetical protein ABI591_17845 [Kofleriaceae bacterium]